MQFSRRQFVGLMAAGSAAAAIGSATPALADGRATTTQGSGDPRIFPALPGRRGHQVLLDLTSATFDEKALFVSLQGQVNRQGPRIWVWYPSGGAGRPEASSAWPGAFGVHPEKITDPYAALKRFRRYYRGLTVYDTKVPATLNLATTLASRSRTLTVSGDLAARLIKTDPTLSIVDDLRGRFDSPLAVYQWAHDHLWSSCPHSFVIGLDPSPDSVWGVPGFSGFIRDYAIATGSIVLYLDTSDDAQKSLLGTFLDDLPTGESAYLGWFTDEGTGVTVTSAHGVETVGADRVLNLTQLAHGPALVARPRAAAPVPVRNKIYVSVSVSDGDNMQYDEHYMRYLWDTYRGRTPLTWTISPSLLHLAPEMYSYYARTKSPADSLMTGPSGLAYLYVSSWPTGAATDAYLARMDTALRRTGITTANIWNGNDAFFAEAFQKVSTLSTITTQDVANGVSRIMNSGDAIIDFASSYSQSLDDIKGLLTDAGKSFGGKAPMFVAAQMVSWKIDIPALAAYLKSLDSRFAVVNIEQMGALVRRACAPAHVEPGTCTLSTFSDGMVMGVAGAGAEDGAEVTQQKATGDASQQWTIVPSGSGYYRLRNARSGKALAVAGAGTGMGAHLVQNGSADDGADRWRFVLRHTGRMSLVNRHSGLVADVNTGSTDAGTPLIQWEDLGVANQSFGLQRV